MIINNFSIAASIPKNAFSSYEFPQDMQIKNIFSVYQDLNIEYVVKIRLFKRNKNQSKPRMSTIFPLVISTIKAFLSLLDS